MRTAFTLALLLFANSAFSQLGQQQMWWLAAESHGISAGGGGFSPDELALTQWWPKDVSNYSTNAGQAVLTDIQGNYDLTNFVSSQFPTTTITLNGYNTIRFDGGDFLRNFAATNTQPCETWVLVNSRDAWPDSVQTFYDSTSSAHAHVLLHNGSAVQAGAGVTLSYNPAAGPTNQWLYYRVVYNGASSSINTNGVQAVAGNAGTVNMSGLTLGMLDNLSLGGNFDFAWGMTVNSNLNADAALNVATWLTNTFGL